MCGIAGVYLLDDSLKVNLDAMLDTMLDAIEHRGGDATGFVAFGDEGVLEWQKAACGRKRLRQVPPSGSRREPGRSSLTPGGQPKGCRHSRRTITPSRGGRSSRSTTVTSPTTTSSSSSPVGSATDRWIAKLSPLAWLPLGSWTARRSVMEEIEGAAAIAAVDEKQPKDLALARGYSSPLFVLRTKKIVLFGSTHETVKQAYEKHVGKLPKRAKIVSLKTGTMFLFESGTFQKVNFKAYSPPKVTKWASYTTGTSSLPWQDLQNPAVPKEAKASLGWDTEDDPLECDSCQKQESWKLMEYRVDPETSETFQFCEYCADAWDEDDSRWESWLSRGDDSDDEPTDAEFTVVNEAILAEDA